MPMAEFRIAMNPKTASAKRPSERMRTKKTPMIALKSVKTFPATIEATDRLEASSGGPRLSSRRWASVEERPGGWRDSLTGPFIQERRELACGQSGLRHQ